MNRRIIFLSLAMLALPMAAQNSITYGYDAGGNRIRRTVVLRAKKSPLDKDEEATKLEKPTEADGIRIYPNPVKVLLHVEIPDWKPSEKCSLALYTLSGKMLMAGKMRSSTEDIDMSSYPRSFYILRIEKGKQKTSWKIIKE